MICAAKASGIAGGVFAAALAAETEGHPVARSSSTGQSQDAVEHAAYLRNMTIRRNLDDLLVPRVEPESFEFFCDAVSMSDDQQIVARALFDEYRGWLSQLRANISRSEKFTERDVAREVELAWPQLDEHLDELTANLRALADDGQSRRYEEAASDLRRDVMLNAMRIFPGYTPFHTVGDTFNLSRFARDWVRDAPIARDAEATEAFVTEMRRVLDEYDKQLDLILPQSLEKSRRARLEFWAAAGDDKSDRRRAAWRLDRSAWQSRIVLSESAANQLALVIAELLGEDVRSRWEADLGRQVHPGLFRDPFRNVWTWLDSLELTGDAAATVQASIEQYHRRVAAARQVLVREIREDRNREPDYAIERSSVGFAVKTRMHSAISTFHNESARYHRELAIELVPLLGRDNWSYLMTGMKRGED